MDRELERRIRTGHLHPYKNRSERNSERNGRVHWVVPAQGDLVDASQYQAMLVASGGRGCSLVTSGRECIQRAGSHEDS